MQDTVLHTNSYLFGVARTHCFTCRDSSVDWAISACETVLCVLTKFKQNPAGIVLYIILFVLYASVGDVQFEAMDSNVDTTITRAKTVVNAASAVSSAMHCHRPSTIYFFLPTTHLLKKTTWLILQDILMRSPIWTLCKLIKA